jgi:hypothetical protein
MSGYTDDAITHQGLLDEGSPFLDKPIRPQLLLERVREALGGDTQAGTGTAAGR